jgi:MazG family protein
MRGVDVASDGDVDSPQGRRYRRAVPDSAVVQALGDLIDVMARLRAPGGCPWDREQTPATLRSYLVEETYEVLDAIDAGDARALCEELGDLLLQVVFQAEIAAEAGRFDIADVARAIHAKLVRRHPHVFGDVEVADADEVARNWRHIKAAERRAAGEDDAFAGVPRALPALAHAQQLGDKAAHLGLDWPDVAGVVAKLHEEQEELERALASGDGAAVGHEIGDVLLTVTSLARHTGVAAEMALREANARFVARARGAEAAARARGTTLAALAADERERLWQAAKTGGGVV